MRAGFVLCWCVGAFFVSACGTAKSEASVRVLAQGVFSAAGGTLTAPTGESIVIPPGALDRETVFAIKWARDVYAPEGSSLLSEGGYLFEPADYAFLKPVRITVPIPAGSVSEAESVVLLNRSLSMSAWYAHAGVSGDATSISAAMTRFSLVVAVRKDSTTTECFAETACDLQCDPVSEFPASSCSGSCDLRGSSFATAGFHCEPAAAGDQNATNTRVACGCISPGDGSAVPRRSDTYYYDALGGEASVEQMLFMLKVWCEWPCNAPSAADSGVADASLGVADASSSDAATIADADVVDAGFTAHDAQAD